MPTPVVTPTSVVTPTPTVAESSVVIEWADNSDNESGFIVERKEADESPFLLLKVLPADTVTYTDSKDLFIGGYYCYRIIAFNTAGRSISDKFCVDVTY
ncbi:MAG: fibronectin type III domain-containing protein [Alteromonadales bacterium]|nr:fibronectin type III domain-containing protein [Alteromonadales bacterium]